MENKDNTTKLESTLPSKPEEESTSISKSMKTQQPIMRTESNKRELQENRQLIINLMDQTMDQMEEKMNNCEESAKNLTKPSTESNESKNSQRVIKNKAEMSYELQRIHFESITSTWQTLVIRFENMFINKTELDNRLDFHDDVKSDIFDLLKKHKLLEKIVSLNAYIREKFNSLLILVPDEYILTTSDSILMRAVMVHKISQLAFDSHFEEYVNDFYVETTLKTIRTYPQFKKLLTNLLDYTLEKFTSKKDIKQGCYRNDEGEVFNRVHSELSMVDQWFSYIYQSFS